MHVPSLLMTNKVQPTGRLLSTCHVSQFLTFCDTTRDWRCFSPSLSAATRRLISFLSACFAARRPAILRVAKTTEQQVN